MQQIMINTETPNCPMDRELKDYKAITSEFHIYIKLLTSQTQGSSSKKLWKDCKSQRGWTPTIKQFLQQWRQHPQVSHELKPDKSRIEMEKLVRNPNLPKEL